MPNKKAISDNRRAFTLIEILVIVLIIGLLASVILISLGSARTKAKDNSFKSTMKSIQTNLVSCCMSGDVALQNSDLSGTICIGGENYPGPESIGTISAGSCAGGNFVKRFEPGTKNKGNCTEARITVEEITYTGCL